MSELGNHGVEDVLRDDLARGDAVIGTLGPILRHLLTNDDHSLFSDEIVARVRGMLEHLAGQLLLAHADAAGIAEREEFVAQRRDAFVETFLAHAALLGHCHALALEWQLTERLQAGNGADPVLSPLLQALIASEDSMTASLAMAALAAQARFVQTQRRMELPLTELPGDLFHVALLTMRSLAETDGHAAGAEEALRAKFDEANGRLGLIARLVLGMGGGAIAALELDHAGVAIFLTALAIGSGQERDLAVLATNDRQLARLALALRAAGLAPAAIEEQFLHLHPEVVLPAGFEDIGTERAATLLSASTLRVSG